MEYEYAPKYSQQITRTITYSPSEQVYYSPTVIIGSPEATVTKKEASMSTPTNVSPTQSAELRDDRYEPRYEPEYRPKYEPRTDIRHDSGDDDMIRAIAMAIGVSAVGYIALQMFGEEDEK